MNTVLLIAVIGLLILVLYRQKPRPTRPQSGKVAISMSYVVKTDNPDVGYSVTVGEAKDSEGNVVPDAQLGITVESDNSDVVEITQNEDPKTGSIHFGNPGNATVTVNVYSGETLLGSGAASFVVTTGDPASISGVAVAFEGLTETPPA